MPFRFDLGNLSSIVHGRRSHVIDFTLGFDAKPSDLSSAERVMMSVALLEDDGGGNPFELVFGIRRQKLFLRDVSQFAFDHATARRYVPKAAAGVVMLLLSCVRRLVIEIDPVVIVMETFEANLPASALGKYMRVVSHLGLCGYDMTGYRRDGIDMKDYWLFMK